MKIPTVLALTIMALCVMECCASDPTNRNVMTDILKKIEKAAYPCPGLWTKFEDSCYHVKATIMSWEEAKKYCEGIDGNLVKINSLKENLFVLDVVRKYAPSLKQVWLGFQWKEIASPKDYYWYDDSVPTFWYGAPGETNHKAPGYCGLMYVGGHSTLPQRASGYWNDVRCTNPAYPNGVVCKKLA